MPRFGIATLALASVAQAAHIIEVDSVPTILTVPELWIPRPGYAALPDPNSSIPIGLRHSFVGLTDVGFVEYHYNVLQSPLSIHAEDYDALFAASAITCEPVEAGMAPAWAADGSLIRNDVRVTVTFATPSADEEAALAHFLPRALTPGAFLTFDPAIHAENPSFAPGASCAEQLPWEAGAYAIASAVEAPSALTLVLTPVHARETHHMMDVSMRWDPNATREVDRRMAAGESLGRDARRRLAGRSLAATTISDSRSISLNWNGVIGPGAAASAKTVEVVPGAAGLLTCTNCFAYLAVGYSVTFQFCVGLDVGGYVWLYTSQNPKGDMGLTPSLIPFSSPTISPATTTANMADCVASLAPWMSSSATNLINKNSPSNPTGISDTIYVPATFITPAVGGPMANAAFNVDAYVIGGAGFNFLVTSNGFTGSGSTPSCNFPAGATDSSTCTTPTTLFDTNGPAFTFPITTGITAGIGDSVTAAAIYSGSLKCSLSFGAGASASAKLGGTAQVKDMLKLASGTLPALSAYKKFDLSYSSTPFSASFTSASGSIDATFFLNVVITINSAIPITVTAGTRFTGAMSAGSLAGSTSGSSSGSTGTGGSSSGSTGTSGGSSSGGTVSTGTSCTKNTVTINMVTVSQICYNSVCSPCPAPPASCSCARRELRGTSPAPLPAWGLLPRHLADSLATCPTTGTYTSLSNSALVGATAGPVTFDKLLTGIVSAAGVTIPSAFVQYLPTTTLVPLTTVVPLTSNGPPQPLVAACVASGASLTGDIGGVGSAALSSTGGGASASGAGGSGGGSSSGASASSGSCGGGCVAGIIIALLIVIAIVAGLAYYFLVVKRINKSVTTDKPAGAPAVFAVANPVHPAGIINIATTAAQPPASGYPPHQSPAAAYPPHQSPAAAYPPQSPAVCPPQQQAVNPPQFPTAYPPQQAIGYASLPHSTYASPPQPSPQVMVISTGQPGGQVAVMSVGGQ